jgi:hypothetical protein
VTDRCVHEQDVVDAVLSRRWDVANETLTQHAAGCEICSDVVAVSRLLAADLDRARYDVRVPAAGQIWWRSAVRARLEGAHAAARPLNWLHGIATACALGLTVAGVGMLWPSLREMVSWLAARTLVVDASVADVATLVIAALQRSLPLAFVVAACVVLAPVALYFVLTDD